MSRPDRLIRVATGVLFDQAGRVLLQQRRSDAHQGGLWEFPGGKIEPGESDYQALCRELDEELGVEVLRASRLIQLEHDYPDLKVALEVWLVDDYRSEPQSREQQPLQWVDLDRLQQMPIPAADLPIIEVLLERFWPIADTSRAALQPVVPGVPDPDCSQ